jgi:hypothetical protein
MSSLSTIPADVLNINTTTEPTSGTRLTLTSTTSYSTIVTRFRTLVPQIPTPLDRTSLEAFTQQISAALGPHGYARFHEYNHGAWISLFPSNKNTAASEDIGPNKGLGLHRFVIGNPLIAITMIREDVEAGLHLPIDLLFIETEDRRAKCVLQLPSGLIAGHERGQKNERLLDAVRALDRKVLALLEEVMA